MNKRIQVFTNGHIEFGVGVNMAALPKALVGRGHNVSCAQRYENTEYRRRLAAAGVKYYWFSRSPNEDISGFINDHQTPYAIFRQARLIWPTASTARRQDATALSSRRGSWIFLLSSAKG